MSNLSLLARGALAAVVVAAAAVAQAQSQPQSPAAGSTTAGGATRQPTIDAAFKRADVNGDAKLSSDELAQFPSLAPRFADLDKN